MSRLDYALTRVWQVCPPKSMIATLQRVQNTAARLIMNLGPCDCVNFSPQTPSLVSGSSPCTVQAVHHDALHLYSAASSLLNYFHSAYIKYHSTETTLLSVHDHIIKAMSHQQVTCLILFLTYLLLLTL